MIYLVTIEDCVDRTYAFLAQHEAERFAARLRLAGIDASEPFDVPVHTTREDTDASLAGELDA